MTRSTSSERLHRYIDALSDAEATLLLDYVHMLGEPDDLIAEDEEIIRLASDEGGDYVSGDELERELGLAVVDERAAWASLREKISVLDQDDEARSRAGQRLSA